MDKQVQSRKKGIIVVNGREFRDLNGNGVVDPYENWELPTEERVRDLVSRMTLEEKAGLMTVSLQYMPFSEEIPGDLESKETDESGLLNETDIVHTTHPFSEPGDENYELPRPLLYTAGATKGIRDLNLRYFIIRDNPEATHALLFISPMPVPERPDEPLSVDLDDATGIDTERVRMIEGKVPTILAVNMTNPWLIGGIEPDAQVVLATFGVKHEAFIDVLRGRYNPSGKLPFTLPADRETLDRSPGDIPGHAQRAGYAYRDKNGNEYAFGYGRSYD